MQPVALERRKTETTPNELEHICSNADGGSDQLEDACSCTKVKENEPPMSTQQVINEKSD